MTRREQIVFSAGKSGTANQVLKRFYTGEKRRRALISLPYLTKLEEQEVLSPSIQAQSPGLTRQRGHKKDNCWMDMEAEINEDWAMEKGDLYQISTF